MGASLGHQTICSAATQSRRRPPGSRLAGLQARWLAGYPAAGGLAFSFIHLRQHVRRQSNPLTLWTDGKICENYD